jgi:hypothetical protein
MMPLTAWCVIFSQSPIPPKAPKRTHRPEPIVFISA